MITERGTVKVSTPITEQTQRELNASSKKLSIVYLVIAPILLVLGVAIILFVDETIGDCFIIIGLILLVLGIFLLLVINKAVKTVSQSQRTTDTEFFNGYMIVREYTDGEHTATIKFYYRNISKIKETPNYIFMYNTRVTVVSVFKGNLTAQELTAVRSLISRCGAANVAPQPMQSGANNGMPTVAANAPADPFADLSADKKAESGETNGEGDTQKDSAQTESGAAVDPIDDGIN